jgi:hypothetical protein
MIYRKRDYPTHARRFPSDNRVPINMIKFSSMRIVGQAVLETILQF